MDLRDRQTPPLTRIAKDFAVAAKNEKSRTTTEDKVITDDEVPVIHFFVITNAAKLLSFLLWLSMLSYSTSSHIHAVSQLKQWHPAGKKKKKPSKFSLLFSQNHPVLAFSN